MKTHGLNQYHICFINGWWRDACEEGNSSGSVAPLDSSCFGISVTFLYVITAKVSQNAAGSSVDSTHS